jgi:hypothetical protein
MDPVFLHVGPAKTGSTFLQHLLWINQDRLLLQGFLEPSETEGQMWAAANDAQGCAYIHFAMPEAAGSWQRICERVAGYDGPVILSQEIFALSSEEDIYRIAAALAPRPIVLIVHARNLAALIPSAWQENIKAADPTPSWPDFLAKQRRTRLFWSDAAAIVRRWRRCAPVCDAHVVVVPPKGSPRNVLLHRFAEAMGIDVATWRDDQRAMNRSLDSVQAEAIRLLNWRSSSFLSQATQRHIIQQTILPMMPPPDPNFLIKMPASEWAWVSGETERRIDELVRSGAAIHGDLAELVPRSEDWHSEAEFVPDRAVSLLLADLLIAQCGPVVGNTALSSLDHAESTHGRISAP